MLYDLRKKIFPGVKSDVKIAAAIRGVDLRDCRRQVAHMLRYDSHTKEYYSLMIRNSQLCAIFVDTQESRSCQSNSGGPLMGLYRGEKSNYWYLAGIVSYRPRHCGSKGVPGIYTRVTDYIDWIKANIRPFIIRDYTREVFCWLGNIKDKPKNKHVPAPPSTTEPGVYFPPRRNENEIHDEEATTTVAGSNESTDADNSTLSAGTQTLQPERHNTAGPFSTPETGKPTSPTSASRGTTLIERLLSVAPTPTYNSETKISMSTSSTDAARTVRHTSVTPNVITTTKRYTKIENHPTEAPKLEARPISSTRPNIAETPKTEIPSSTASTNKVIIEEQDIVPPRLQNMIPNATKYDLPSPAINEIPKAD